MLPTAGANTSTKVASTNCFASCGVVKTPTPSGTLSSTADDAPIQPISPSTRIAGLIDLIASIAFFVWAMFSSKGSADPSKLIASNPALAATSALAIE